MSSLEIREDPSEGKHKPAREMFPYTMFSEGKQLWGQATVCRPDAQRRKVEYKVNSQERKEMWGNLREDESRP